MSVTPEEMNAPLLSLLCGTMEKTHPAPVDVRREMAWCSAGTASGLLSRRETLTLLDRSSCVHGQRSRYGTVPPVLNVNVCSLELYVCDVCVDRKSVV